MDAIERHFSPAIATQWVDKYWRVSVYASVLYVAAVFIGRWYMRDKAAFDLRRTLVFWNTCLAAFSAVGLYRLLPELGELLRSGGLTLSVCHCRMFTEPSLGLWLFVFAVAKMVELGDTAFIVLRKTPLSFLHWYHHITVLVYCWYFYPMETPLSNWFATLNYGAHTMMYTYYALKGCRYRVPVWAAQFVTVLQMTQFLVSLVCTIYAYYLKSNGFPDCNVGPDKLLRFTLAMYGSYLLLFVHFFYERYFKKRQ